MLRFDYIFSIQKIIDSMTNYICITKNDQKIVTVNNFEIKYLKNEKKLLSCFCVYRFLLFV